MDNRAILLIFAGKLLFYIFLVFGLLRILFGFFTTIPKNYIAKSLSNERTVMGKRFAVRQTIVICIKVILFLWMLGICLNNLAVNSHNKTEFSTVGINLKSINTEMTKQIEEAYVDLVSHPRSTSRRSTTRR